MRLDIVNTAFYRYTNPLYNAHPCILNGIQGPRAVYHEASQLSSLDKVPCGHIPQFDVIRYSPC